jgi:hypothetical protein
MIEEQRAKGFLQKGKGLSGFLFLFFCLAISVFGF